MKQLRVALPTTDKVTVDEHFGHCKMFAIHTIEDNKVVSIEHVMAPPHAPGVLPKFLGEQNVTTIITGGMGQRAIELFKEQDIDVILGARGTIEENLATFMEGDLMSTGSACSHNHDDESCNH
ncbi:MAG: NifB/NifX family molybdenum-iron cluster-binding protein [Clostridia bacterium]|nr:NifB/NifX family molybdenum-iron cluster-binding protein [Clostridia bacterium]